jgi:hypothetical protein
MGEAEEYNKVMHDVQTGVSEIVCGNIPTDTSYNNSPNGTIVTKNNNGTYTLVIAKSIR